MTRPPIHAEKPADRLFRLAAATLPRLLTLQDRNPHSPTYGCFDRKFWHLRVTDFPSGMAQEFVLPMALAYAHDFPGNPFQGHPTLREWIRAGIDYAARSAHPDGSCDDYYPFEKAAGAAAFSLYAMIEALPLAGLDPDPFLPFLIRRGHWLGTHRESGRLSNHEALIANTLFRLARLSREERFADMARERVRRLLSWQTDEGWFYEYQGCDPGYLTLTIANLAEIDALEPDLGLRDPIARAVRFLCAILPPDGWPGGEWTSRNTNNYFPHGLELAGAWIPEALQLNSAVVAALDPAPDYGDDQILGHHAWSYLKAALGWQGVRPAAALTAPQPVNFPKAGYRILRQGAFTLLVATKKGGSYRLYHNDRLARADTGISLRVAPRRKLRTYVCHLWAEDNLIDDTRDGITISGAMGRAKSSGMTPLANVVLRCLMLTLGRFHPDLVRRMLQKLLITGASPTPFRFERTLRLSDDGLQVTDRIKGTGRIESIGVGTAKTEIYTAMSRVYHPPQLQPWEDLTDALRPDPENRLTVTRQFGATR